MLPFASAPGCKVITPGDPVFPGVRLMPFTPFALGPPVGVERIALI
jgi:hypothetical protein